MLRTCRFNQKVNYPAPMNGNNVKKKTENRDPSLYWNPNAKSMIDKIVQEEHPDTFRMHSYFIENIIMFIPLGIFPPILFYKMRRCQYCVFTGFLCSGTIEIAQFISQRGFLQVDDIFTNTIGTLIGWMTWRVWRRIRKK